jgi:sulfur-carrier protein
LIRVELPNVFCSQPNDRTSVVLKRDCGTIAEALSSLGEESPAALDRIMDERGDVRRHVNIFLNDDNIRFLDGLSTRVPKNATIFVLAAVSGG